VEHATEVEHCKVFNYAAVARLDKGEYVVKELLWLSWSRQSSWWGDIQLFANVRWLWVYGRVSFSTFVRDSRLGPIEGTLRYWRKYYQKW
jgi:hypothetical protein